MKVLTLLNAGGLLFAAILFISCSQHQTDEEASDDAVHVVAKNDSEKNVAVRMPLSDVTTSFQLQGKDYEARIFRSPDETMPKVKNEQGDEFVDNSITLRVTSEGKILLNRSFTKSSFASLLHDRFLKSAILEGIVYDTVVDGKARFAASVSYPESDLYVPIHLLVSASGQVSIEKAELLDDLGDEAGDRYEKR